MLRSAIFCVPYFLNGAHIQAAVTDWWVADLLGLIIFGLGLSIVYLLLFNRRTRQSLHDLAVGAYVVRGNDGEFIAKAEHMWPGHIAVVCLIVITSLLIPFVGKTLADSPQLRELFVVQQTFLREPNVSYAGVHSGFNRFFSSKSGSTTTKIFSARIYLLMPLRDIDPLANRLAQIMLDRAPSSGSADAISLSLIYGYDIGIASSWNSQNLSFSPAAWRKRISPLPGAVRTTGKKELIHDPAPNEEISLGDKAADASDFAVALTRYQSAAKGGDAKVVASAQNRIGELV